MEVAGAAVGACRSAVAVHGYRSAVASAFYVRHHSRTRHKTTIKNHETKNDNDVSGNSSVNRSNLAYCAMD
jgi:hypothetical protein